MLCIIKLKDSTNDLYKPYHTLKRAKEELVTTAVEMNIPMTDFLIEVYKEGGEGAGNVKLYDLTFENGKFVKSGANKPSPNADSLEFTLARIVELAQSIGATPSVSQKSKRSSVPNQAATTIRWPRPRTDPRTCSV